MSFHPHNGNGHAGSTLIDDFLAEQRRVTAVDRFSQRHDTHEFPAQEKYYRDLIPLNRPGPGEQYAFVVELDKCSGCKACVCACHSLNGLDEGEMWRGVGLLHTARDGGAAGSEASPPAFQQHVTTACHHCVEPGCADGCPVLAYEKDPVTGIVRHLDDQCIGCQYCVLKCPYDVPKYSEAKGIVRKCDMCHGRLAVGEAPACVQACPHEAIRIEVVSQGEARATAAIEGSRLVPGAFPSNYTKPTTLYRSRRPVPSGLRPADEGVLRLEPAHWPLVFMLVLAQGAAGLHVVYALLAGFEGARPMAALGWAALALLVAGLNVSVFHLGRPLKAWRAFLGWRRSWMSREIMAFSGYAAAAGLLMVIPGNLVAAAAVAVTALGSVFCSAMIYVDTRRPAWDATTVFGRFFGTTLHLGCAGAAVWAGWSVPEWAPAFAVAALLVHGALLGWEWRRLLRARRDASSPAHTSARTAWTLLKPVLAVRVVLFFVAATLSILTVLNAAQLGVVWVSIAGALAVLSQLLERYLFFVTCHAPRMPGGVTP